jgi:aldose 1-epimerase
VKHALFGRLPDGRAVEAYELSGPAGLRARVLTYGGIIQELLVPGRDGDLADVVLGGADLGFYLRRHPYFGSIVGRVAGRISRGIFRIGPKDYHLAVNNPPNHLHGGENGLDRRLWQAEPCGEDTLVLRYRSPDGEEGYPGQVDLTVTYRLTPAGELVIESEARTEATTPVSLTNHSYFNLAGEGSGSTADHRVEIFADEYVPTDADLTLSGVRTPVRAGGNDLRQPVAVRDLAARLALGHGDNYLLRPSPDGQPVLAARLIHPQSGRKLEVRTNESCLQFYTGAFLDGTFTGKGGVAYTRQAGLCFECQGYPDGVAHPELGDILVHPDRPQRRTTVYAFGVAAAGD